MQNNTQNKAKLPKLFVVMLAIAPIFLAGGIIMIVFGAMGDFGGDIALIIPGAISIFLSFVFLMIGLLPQLHNLVIKTAKYLQENNKEDLKDIASGTAEITDDAVTKTTKAIHKGLKNTKFCKYCGAEIDAKSNFCSNCGKDLR